jgi:hypothetical protein
MHGAQRLINSAAGGAHEGGCVLRWVSACCVQRAAVRLPSVPRYAVPLALQRGLVIDGQRHGSLASAPKARTHTTATAGAPTGTRTHLQSTARESPTLHVNSLLPTTATDTAVDPSRKPSL